MTRSERLSPVARLAENRKRDAARVVSETNRKLREYEKKLKELKKFRREYAMLDGANSQVLTASLLQERQHFIRQLDEGIQFLENKVAGEKQNCAVEKQVWMEAYRRSDAIEGLIEKMQKFESQVRERRSDNASDDRAQHRKVKL